MQRVEHFNNNVIERLVNTPSTSSPSAYSPSTSSPSPSALFSTPTTTTECTGTNYSTADPTDTCICNADNPIVNHKIGDGKVEIDMCSDGSQPINTTGKYCYGSANKLIYEVVNKKISYRSDATTVVGNLVPAVTKKWCTSNN
jgi:hypothetical protein